MEQGANRGSATLVAARAFNRRTLLQAAGATGLVTLAAPFVARRALGQSSGEVRVFAWAGYISDEMLADFQAKTGITPIYTPYGTNDEAFNTLKASGGEGFDIVMPTVDRVPGYVEFDLVQPLDEAKVNWDGCIESAVAGSGPMGGVVADQRYLAPSDWGTEALAHDKTAAPLVYGEAGYGDLWKPEHAGKVTLRGHSGLVGIGLFLEAQGQLPHPMRDSFTSEEVMRANYDVITAFAIEHKPAVAQFWTNENEAQGAFRTNGCVIGQTWDSSSAALQKEGIAVGYLAPKEGALAWLEGFVIPKGATNLEQAYAWINWYYTPEAGAMYANLTSINTTAKGAEAFLSDFNKQFFAESYPGDALDRLWWWPVQEPWFVSARNEYQDQFLSA